MDIVGIDISKAKFDAALLLGERVRHAVFSNTEAGFQQLLAWLAKHRPDPTVALHACMEATGNWGLELADFLHAQGVRVSIVNPARIKAYGESELARNKTDKLDAGLIPSAGIPLAMRAEPLPAPPLGERLCGKLQRQAAGRAAECRGVQHARRSQGAD